MTWTPYLINVFILIAIYLILATSLNLALGYMGLLNLGHVAFFAIGAYTSAILTKTGLPFIGAFMMAGIVAGIVGYILFFATRKLKGDYLALATLGFSFVTVSLLLNLQSLTQGPLGIAGIAKPSFGSMAIGSNWGYFLFAWLIAIIIIVIIIAIVKSPFGKVLEATRDDEIGVRVLGKDTWTLKGKVMAISAFFAGIAGSIFAHYISYIEPHSFYLSEIILIVTIVILGGLASIPGSIAATFIILLIPELLRLLDLPSSILGPGRQIIFAIILLLMIRFRPRGILGRIDLA